MGRHRIYTDDQLRQILDEGACRTWMEVTVALGLGPHQVNRTAVHNHAMQLGLELKRPAPSGADRGREAR